MAAIQKRFTESNQVKTRRMTADGTLSDVSSIIEAKQHSHPISASESAAISTSHRSKSMVMMIWRVEDICYLTVLLSEEEMVDDLQMMAAATQALYPVTGIPKVISAAPLSGNRLLLNDKVIEPNTPCTLRNGNNWIRNCVFLSTIVKEKENKEKRKDPEVGNGEKLNVDRD